MEADITGLMAKPIEGWKDEVVSQCKPENYQVQITVADEVINSMTEEQLKRLCWKLALVAKAASYMAAGMEKGTRKYPSDDYEIDQWMAHLVGEGADQMNYQILLADSYDKKKGVKHD